MDREVANWNADRTTMLCPVCGFENLKGGDEICVNCGADLPGHDIPQPALSFQSRLLGEHLDELGSPPPLTVGPDTPVDAVIAQMQAAEVDCVLVTVEERLVGIFTDRDAVVKAAGKQLQAFHVRDFMTPDPVVLRHDDPIALAINKMAVGGFRHIPIIRDGRPAGVITARDVFHHLAESLG
jgi:CBS domain-containing protein